MDKNLFWALIDDARSEADSWEDICEPLIDRLSELTAPDIFKWHNIFDEYQKLSYKNKVWAAAYVINGGCSDDGFDYFRGWLTAQGKDVFFDTLNDPDSLADYDDCEEDVELEEMLSIAPYAYFKKLSIEPDWSLYYDKFDKFKLADDERDKIEAEINYADDIDIDWSEDDDLKELLPRLCEKFDW